MGDKKLIIDKKICGNGLDFDGVLAPGEELMDNYIRPVCKEATNEYCRELFSYQRELIVVQQQLEEDRNIYGHEMRQVKAELTEISRKLKIHFDLKDQFLEEADPKYKNVIKYFEIYQRKNVFPGILEVLWAIYDKGIYDLQICCTHVNAENEILAKKGLLTKDFPPMKFIPVKYHLIPYRTNGLVNRNREPSDKVGIMVRNIPNMDVSISPMVDNSKSIIIRSEELGLRPYFVAQGDDPASVIMQAANDTIDLVHGDKIKKLVKTW